MKALTLSPHYEIICSTHKHITAIDVNSSRSSSFESESCVIDIHLLDRIFAKTRRSLLQKRGLYEANRPVVFVVEGNDSARLVGQRQLLPLQGVKPLQAVFGDPDKQVFRAGEMKI